MPNIKFNRVLDIFINDLIPQTRIAVKKGNKIFGAFIIKKSDLSLIITGTNNEVTNPLYHGEISALFNFFESEKLNPKSVASLLGAHISLIAEPSNSDAATTLV